MPSFTRKRTRKSTTKRRKHGICDPEKNTVSDLLLDAGGNHSQSVLQVSTKDRQVKKFRLSRQDECEAQDRDKNPTTGNMSPLEPQKRRSKCSWEDCADCAEHLAEEAVEKTSTLHIEMCKTPGTFADVQLTVFRVRNMAVFLHYKTGNASSTVELRFTM